MRQLYRILGHEGHWSRVGALDVNTKAYDDKYLYGIDEVLDYARHFNGIRNIFIGRNPRSKDGSVLYSNCITFDIDPVREKGLVANDAQHNQALNAGRKVLDHYPGGYLCSSGNGCLLLYPCHIERADLDIYYSKEKAFIGELNNLVQEFGVKVDETSYENAVIKLIGTVSTKGDGRLSRFITISSHGNRNNVKETIEQIQLRSEQVTVEKFNGDPVARIKEAKECLDRINGEHLNNYENWIKVGMALKEFGISGLALWKDWSKKSEKYEEGICEKKWDTFKEVPEITLGSLKLWAGANKSLAASTNTDGCIESYFSNLFTKDCAVGQTIFTGIPSLDRALGPLPKGEITTIAARSGFGKSSFACTVSESLRANGRKVLYFSTEMSRDYIMHKFVSIACNIPLEKFVSKEFISTERESIKYYEQEFNKLPIIICDEFSPTIELVKDLCEKHKPDVLVFDHVTQSGTHWEYIAQFVRGLKTLTMQLNCVTLLASQLNEPPRDQKGSVGTSVRGDVRGSQEIIFLSAIFVLINNLYEVKTDIQPVEIEVCKNRYGLSGIKVECHVNKTTGLFTE